MGGVPPPAEKQGVGKYLRPVWHLELGPKMRREPVNPGLVVIHSTCEELVQFAILRVFDERVQNQAVAEKRSALTSLA
jgi:hypothetical protein